LREACLEVHEDAQSEARQPRQLLETAVGDCESGRQLATDQQLFETAEQLLETAAASRPAQKKRQKKRREEEEKFSNVSLSLLRLLNVRRQRLKSERHSIQTIQRQLADFLKVLGDRGTAFLALGQLKGHMGYF
jgi:hypothetical protein